MDQQPHRIARISAWRERMHATALTRFWYRIAIGVAGLVCMIGSLLTGWLPGPGGIPLFLLGLWIWSTEFAWAARLMDHVKGWIDRYQQIPVHRRRLLVGGFLLAALISWYAFAAWQGLPTWLPDGARRQLARLPLIEG